MLFLGFFILVILLVCLTIAILFLLTQQNTLKAVSPANRKMEPGMVWLSLIPLFNLIWQFIVVRRIAESIEAEYRSRGMETKSLPTYNIGLAYCILNCVSITLYLAPTFQMLASPAGIICWIIYWIQVNDQKNRLRSLPPAGYGDSQIFGNLEG